MVNILKPHMAWKNEFKSLKDLERKIIGYINHCHSLHKKYNFMGSLQQNYHYPYLFSFIIFLGSIFLIFKNGIIMDKIKINWINNTATSVML